MATIKIIADSNADAVWVWELVKKLGYEVEVVFDCPDDVQPNNRCELLPKNEASKLLAEIIRVPPKESRFVGYDNQIGGKVHQDKRKKRQKFRR